MLRYQIVKRMLKDLLSDYPLGSKIPSRPELCTRFDASRMTVDKAIHELEEERFLYSLKGSGTYVGISEEAEVPRGKEVFCILTPDDKHEYWNALVRGARESAEAAGAELLRANTEGSCVRQAELLQKMGQKGVLGILMVPEIPVDSRNRMELIRALEKVSVPVIFCDRELEGADFPLVRISHYHTGYLGTEYLFRLGYRRIAYAADLRHSLTQGQYEGFSAAQAEHEVSETRAYLPEDNLPRIARKNVIQLLLDEYPDLDAILCCSDSLAAAAYEELRARGKQPGKDIAIMGTDGNPDFKELSPSLTTFRTEGEEDGKKAMNLLLRCRRKGTLTAGGRYFSFPSLKEGESCPPRE